jgi:hypothetical protein
MDETSSDSCKPSAKNAVGFLRWDFGLLKPILITSSAPNVVAKANHFGSLETVSLLLLQSS